jgi:hypothetical protein
MSLLRTIRTLEGQSPRQGWAGHPSRLGRLLLLGWFALVPARGRIDDVTHWAIGDCCARFALLSPRRIRAAGGSPANRTRPSPRGRWRRR